MSIAQMRKTVTLSDGTVVGIRRLKRTERAEAARLYSIAQIKNLTEMGGAAAIETIKHIQDEAKKEVARQLALATGTAPTEATAADDDEALTPAEQALAPKPLHHETVLNAGIEKWSRPEPVTPETIDTYVDEDDAQLLYDAICALHDRKNA